jgi:predicted amidohydrolase
MRVLLGQLAPVAGEPRRNAETIARHIAEHPDAELAVFPELFLSGYRAPDLDGASVDAISSVLEPVLAAAEKHATAAMFGFAERHDGQIANSVGLVAADGSWRGSYRKTHLFGGWERETFTAGDALRLVELADERVGPLICFDMEFPEPARALARAGASLLVTCSANMEPYGPDHALAMRARALDNRLPHVYVNRVGEEAGLRFAGGSAVIAADGSIVAELGSVAEVRCVELPTDHHIAADVDYLALLRPDLEVEGTASTIAEGGAR